jgi:hypothetical protein
MWDLVIYEIVPWDKLIHVTKMGRYYDLGDCLQIYSMVVGEIAKATDLMGTYIPMCVRVL